MHTMSTAERRRQVAEAIRLLQRSIFLLNRPLLKRLNLELAAIDRGERELPGVTKKTLRWLSRLESPEAFMRSVLQDPLNEFNRHPPSSTRGVAQRIFALRAAAGGRFTSLSQLRLLGARGDIIIDDLLYTGAVLPVQEIAPPPPPPPEPVVGVLLPVRLETRFYPPANPGEEWGLRVLVVPDEPSIDRHDPLPFAAELDSVEWLWQNAPGGLDTPEGRTAWSQFAARHGPGRAAWLARSFPPLPPDADGVVRVARPTEIRTEPAVSRVRGLPPQLELWLARGGGAPVQIATSTVDDSLLGLDFPDPTDPNDQRWWSAWETALKAGLAFEVSLGAAFPGDIDVLYVTGLGEEDSAGLFEAHRDQGALGLIEPGKPTNTVDGDPAASLARDPETWRRIVLDPANIAWGSHLTSRALTGKPDTLGPLPGDTFTHGDSSHALIQALYMVLWGHALKDLWGLGEDVYLAGAYAARYLAPEGPLPPLRVNDQPYGLLPITSLNDFKPSGSQPDFAHLEANLLPHLRHAQDLWAAAAEAEGTVAGADTERLLELLGRTPSSNAYAFRYFLSLDLLHLLYFAFDGGLDVGAVEDWWRDATAELDKFGLQPSRRYAALGWPQDLKIPLVAPEDYPPELTFKEFLSEFLNPDEFVEGGPAFWMEVTRLRPYDHLPASLLARLLMLAKFVAAAEVHRAAQGQTGSRLEPLGAPRDSLTRLAEDALKMSNNDLGSAGWATELYTMVLDATQTILERPVGELDRVFRAVLDTAAYRIDPWITALAWRRLEESAANGRPFRLGVYGWVDAPQPGTPGPTAGGLLHAPSEPQALTAVILRDKAIHDPEAGRWDINLESASVRLADEIAQEVRLGAHLSEVLGRQVERIAARKPVVDQLRKDFPLRTEHEGRRVCDGLAVLQADPTALPLDPTQAAALEPLRQALDAYGDLLVAEAVHHVVSGRGELAAAAMEAAAGLGAPPQLDVISTRRTGRAVSTNVVIALPPAPDPAVEAGASPGEMADPAAAAFLEASLGPASAAPWLWPVLTPSGAAQSVSLADTGLAVVDTLAVSEEDLVRFVLAASPSGSLLDRQWRLRQPDDTLLELRLSDLGLELVDILSLSEKDLEAHLLRLAPAGSVVLDSPLPAGTLAQRRARRLAAALGRQPARPADLVDTEDEPDDSAVRSELLGRFTRLADTAVLAQAALAAAAASLDEDQQRAALLLAARWGITPVQQVTDTLADQVARAAAALQERLDRAPDSTAAADLDAPGLAAAIAELAAPEGQIPVLSRLDLSGLPTPFSAAPDLDHEWLSVNAAVRTPLADLESEQLSSLLAAGAPLLDAWTNRPGDPWQADVPESLTGARPPTRLVAVYGTPGLLPAAPGDPADLPAIAAGLLDSWGETIPDVDQATTAAFGFNAPAARAPQAILLAVPPVETEPMDSPTLAAAVASARRLAHARMASPRSLHRLSAAIPTLMFPASGLTGVPLD